MFGNVLGFIRTKHRVAHPVVITGADLLSCSNFTDSCKFPIGGNCHRKRNRTYETLPNYLRSDSPYDLDLYNLSYFPQNKLYKKLKENTFHTKTQRDRNLFFY